MSILVHPQLAGEIHRFLGGNPNTFLRLRLVSRTVGTYVTSWMVEELCEYVLLRDEPAVRPEFIADMVLVCGALDLVPIAMENEEKVQCPDSYDFHHSSILAGGGAALMWTRRVQWTLKAQRPDAARAWSRIAMLLSGIDHSMHREARSRYREPGGDWLTLPQVSERALSIDATLRCCWAFLYDRFGKPYPIINGVEYDRDDLVDKAIQLDPRQPGPWADRSRRCAFRSEAVPSVLMQDLNRIDEGALPSREDFNPSSFACAVVALLRGCQSKDVKSSNTRLTHNAELEAKWSRWCRKYDSRVASMTFREAACVCACEFTDGDAGPFPGHQWQVASQVAEFLCELLGQPNGWCFAVVKFFHPILRSENLTVCRNLCRSLSKPIEALHRQGEWFLHAKRCTLRLLWLMAQAHGECYDFDFAKDNMCQWLNSRLLLSDATRVAWAIMVKDVWPAFFLDNDARVFCELGSVMVKYSAVTTEVCSVIALLCKIAGDYSEVLRCDLSEASLARTVDKVMDDSLQALTKVAALGYRKARWCSSVVKEIVRLIYTFLAAFKTAFRKARIADLKAQCRRLSRDLGSISIKSSAVSRDDTPDWHMIEELLDELSLLDV